MRSLNQCKSRTLCRAGRAPALRPRPFPDPLGKSARIPRKKIKNKKSACDKFGHLHKRPKTLRTPRATKTDAFTPVRRPGHRKSRWNLRVVATRYPTPERRPGYPKKGWELGMVATRSLCKDRVHASLGATFEDEEGEAGEEVPPRGSLALLGANA